MTSIDILSMYNNCWLNVLKVLLSNSLNICKLRIKTRILKQKTEAFDKHETKQREFLRSKLLRSSVTGSVWRFTWDFRRLNSRIKWLWWELVAAEDALKSIFRRLNYAVAFDNVPATNSTLQTERIAGDRGRESVFFLAGVVFQPNS